MHHGIARYYWPSQTTGWTLYSLILGAYNYLINQLNISTIVQLFVVVILLGIAISNLYRFLIVKGGWLELHMSQIIPRMILGSIVFGVLYSLLFALCVNFISPEVEPVLTSKFSTSFTFFFSWTVVFLLWSLVYLAYHYLRNYEREEVKNLRLQSSQNEVELASLKAQLNPHFIFNAMNSIRALVDEDPYLAKTAITKLSNIMRKSLLSDKRNLITLNEELELVRDHLSLEKIRYEERLELSFDIDASLGSLRLPPLIIQTLVENAIKHGISKLQNGGILHVSANAMGDLLRIEVENSGRLQARRQSTGIGLDNLRRRLDILYGDKAQLNLSEIGSNKVRASIVLPITKTQTS